VNRARLPTTKIFNIKLPDKYERKCRYQSEDQWVWPQQRPMWWKGRAL